MSKNNIDRFEGLVANIKRDGIKELVDYCKKSDFFTAPASTRFHSSHEGGLLEHSLNVYDCLMEKRSSPVWNEILNNIGDESLTIVALFHDLCKTNYYIVEYKNKKVYSENGKKIDSNGRYDWETVPGYTVDDKIPYGHGEKSVMMIEQYMKLKPVERYMVRWHMLFTEPKESYNVLGNAIEKYPAILAISEADLEATYLMESKE